jgi:spore coat polysaccharide biosynthesis protein SpsF (cytidylyltransferase family)
VTGPDGPRVVAIVQARMGSTRLPGKVLADIAGHTMLERVVRRLGRCDRLDEVVVATSTLAQDDAIVDACDRLGVQVVRGDPLDVLGRYALAARATDADIVVRVTSDCPFIDPDVVSAVVAALVDAEPSVDYASNTMTPRTFPRGLDVEAFTAAALFDADRHDRDPGTREHVTPFIQDPARFRSAAVVWADDLSAIRWTVDTEADLDVARRLAGAFAGRLDPGWLELLDVWRQHPEWHDLNAHIEQKKVERGQG